MAKKKNIKRNIREFELCRLLFLLCGKLIKFLPLQEFEKTEINSNPEYKQKRTKKKNVGRIKL